MNCGFDFIPLLEKRFWLLPSPWPRLHNTPRTVSTNYPNGPGVKSPGLFSLPK